jgi:hypothetical protein
MRGWGGGGLVALGFWGFGDVRGIWRPWMLRLKCPSAYQSDGWLLWVPQKHGGRPLATETPASKNG